MYYLDSVETALQRLGSAISGLTNDEVLKIRASVGTNELPKKKTSLFTLFAHQFRDILVYILLGALILSIIAPILEGHTLTLESSLDAIVIFAILVLNATLGFIQEYKAEEAIAELRKLSAPHVRVRRGGVESIIYSRELVPGDIMILEAGDRISADGRIINLSHFAVNESSLTGEAVAITKHTRPLHENLGLAEQRNMVFSGTLVTRGTAEVLVTDTGLRTQLGKIAKLVSDTKLPQTPLESRMRKLSVLLGSFVIGLCALVITIGVSRGMDTMELLLIGVSLAVSAVPEGLPAVVTVCLALGVRRMAKSSALVRRLESLEALGSVTVICADKTGTMTENRMKVVDHWLEKGTTIAALARIAASCNRAVLPDIGDPTEIGLLQFAAAEGIARLAIDDEEIPFTSEQKYMQTRHVMEDSTVTYLKGAPEKIFQLCDAFHKEEAESTAERMAKKGLRVLACAVSENGHTKLVGLIAMEDPPRKTVAASIAKAREAGIDTKMITGDHVETARAIAMQVGIEGTSMTGEQMSKLTNEELQEVVQHTSIFARISPKQKLDILKALKANGQIVAMSGDGVNDAPALKGAHVGIAMGKRGTDVAREASSMVLADDHYGTIVSAISEGRRIYDNIRKFVLFLLRANFDELLFITVAILIGLPLPYLPLHILWLNLMTDSLPALALGLEPPEPDTMKRPPRDPEEHLLSGEWSRLITAGLWAFAIAFLFYLWQLRHGVSLIEARSTTLMLAILIELSMAVTVRSRRPIWEIGFFSNKFMVVALIIPVLMQGLILYTPLASAFHVVPLNLMQWVTIITLAGGGFILFEGMKWFDMTRLRLMQ